MLLIEVEGPSESHRGLFVVMGKRGNSVTKPVKKDPGGV